MNNTPLISVIIPCYNHGRHLQQAIDSVMQQSYAHTEIIVVDDGSTDNTKEVAMSNPHVRYSYQHNQGLSAARNTGMRHSTGEYLVFLDADDYLYQEALTTNLEYLRRHEQLAFVSGSHDKVYVATGVIQPVVKTIPSDHYLHLLRGNYIGMHATVMYSRWVFNEFMFDTSLKACEDYDLYLRIARKHPIWHHENKIAAYCLHDTNMSNNMPLMLNSALSVLKRQQQQLLNKAEATAYAEGLRSWKNYYTQELEAKLEVEEKITKQEYYTLLKYAPEATILKTLHKSAFTITNQLARYTPSKRIRRKLRTMFSETDAPPAVGKVKLGDFARHTPFSTQFGYDRGGPVDRYYIENFLSQAAPLVRGRVLEIGDNAYTLLYGGEKVTRSDILHVDDSNPQATWVGDISHAPHIPDNTFDCIILTQTLHLIYHFREALLTCFRILKPGGSLLLTVPGITPIDHGEWKETWYWSFTDKSMRRLMGETFPRSNVVVYPFGNVFTATAFLYGMGLPEVPPAELLYDDPHYQVIITVKATKNPAS
jgi:glycosyltransferase involved in cell wall biosynthesis/SAM-dependent methyltransferase